MFNLPQMYWNFLPYRQDIFPNIRFFGLGAMKPSMKRIEISQNFEYLPLRKAYNEL